jgi:hypothetical protein
MPEVETDCDGAAAAGADCVRATAAGAGRDEAAGADVA